MARNVEDQKVECLNFEQKFDLDLNAIAMMSAKVSLENNANNFDE